MFDLLAHDPVVALQQRAPRAIAQLRCALGRANDVSEEDCRQHAVADDWTPHAGQEVLDLIRDGVLVVEPQHPITRNLHIA